MGAVAHSVQPNLEFLRPPPTGGEVVNVASGGAATIKNI